MQLEVLNKHALHLSNFCGMRVREIPGCKRICSQIIQFRFSKLSNWRKSPLIVDEERSGGFEHITQSPCEKPGIPFEDMASAYGVFPMLA